MRIGNRDFDTQNNTYIMGILNVTPDSFSDGGRYDQIDKALKHTENMINDGADIIDVGGESTKPGYKMITDNEEIERVVPVIEKIKVNFDIPVSVDTYRSKTALEAIIAGADMVNDIWGLKYDANMAEVIAGSGCACCIMHNRKYTEYNNLLNDMLDDLKNSIEIAKAAGINEKKIIIDPGIGFAKTQNMNLQVMRNLDVFMTLGFPILLGASRKSMIGITLGLPADKRVEGTVVTTVFGVQKGCSFIRVHDIAENKRAILMTKAIMNSNIQR